MFCYAEEGISQIIKHDNGLLQKHYFFEAVAFPHPAVELNG